VAASVHLPGFTLVEKSGFGRCGCIEAAASSDLFHKAVHRKGTMLASERDPVRSREPSVSFAAVKRGFIKMKKCRAFIAMMILLSCFSACDSTRGQQQGKGQVQITGQNENNEENTQPMAQPTQINGNATNQIQSGGGASTMQLSDFKLIIEAEEAEKTGSVRVESKKKGFTGTGYVIGIEEPSDTVVFTVTVPTDGAYDLNFISASYSGYKENNILIDEEFVGVVKTESEEFSQSVLRKVFMTQGEHEVKMTKSWGWIYLDALEVTASEPADPALYQAQTKLCDAKASANTRRMMNYLSDMYGKYIISGQYGDRGTEGPEFKAIKQATDKVPAMMGLDFIEYTPSRAAHGSVGKDIGYAIDFDSQGGIITFCWHWNAPEPYLYNTTEKPWWSGFYTKATNINLKKIMSGDDEEGYNLLIRDIDVIAEELKKLAEKDIPVLWRPLHEASGGWFWWGDSGPEPYIKLYRLLYERLTVHHELHNLIWVWNGQNKEWYPGDDVVDIVGMDIYPGERVYSSQTPKFNDLNEWVPGKIIALTENGCLFDPELAVRDNAMWSYFGTWEGEFVTLNNTYTLSEKYTEIDMVKKVYTHEKVITLDELPDLKTYRLE